MDSVSQRPPDVLEAWLTRGRRTRRPDSEYGGKHSGGLELWRWKSTVLDRRAVRNLTLNEASYSSVYAIHQPHRYACTNEQYDVEQIDSDTCLDDVLRGLLSPSTYAQNLPYNHNALYLLDCNAKFVEGLNILQVHTLYS